MGIKLRQYVRTHDSDRQALVSIHDYVREHGKPDADGLRALSEQLKLPVASIRGAISFYDDLNEQPDAVRVCRGTSCMLAGAKETHGRIRDHAPCEGVYCLGYCDRSPVVLRPNDSVVVQCRYRDADGLLNAHVHPPDTPSVWHTVREPIVTARVNHGECDQLEYARQEGVYDALEMAVKHLDPSRVIDMIEQSGERGRGGAAYSAGKKWRMAAQTTADKRYVIANGDEGDPGSFIDRVLMEHDPHTVIEGLALCAYAVGADEGVVFIRSEYPGATAVMRNAISEAYEARILGASMFGSDFRFELSVFPALGSYVCGEETAMLNAIEGFRGEVSLRPPYPAVEGLWGKPTVVNNVETLVNVPWIVSHGPDAYSALGTPTCSGTKAICLNHGFEQPGIVEVEFGTTLREVIETEAGGGRDGTPLVAVALGGPMGSILRPDNWDVPICYDAMNQRGIRLGHGGLVALPEGTDFRALIRHLLRFMQHESCGKCVPCSLGSSRAYELSETLSTTRDRDGFKNLLNTMRCASLCGFGQLMPEPILEIIELFGDQIFDGEGSGS